jgi:hypothetical protein
MLFGVDFTAAAARYLVHVLGVQRVECVAFFVSVATVGGGVAVHWCWCF